MAFSRNSNSSDAIRLHSCAYGSLAWAYKISASFIPSQTLLNVVIGFTGMWLHLLYSVFTYKWNTSASVWPEIGRNGTRWATWTKCLSIRTKDVTVMPKYVSYQYQQTKKLDHSLRRCPICIDVILYWVLDELFESIANELLWAIQFSDVLKIYVERLGIKSDPTRLWKWRRF